MFRTAFRHGSGAFLLAAIIAAAELVPTSVWGATKPSALSTVAPPASVAAPAPGSDDDDQLSQRMVIGDFNHDGVADMAEAVPAAGKNSGPATLTISLGQADGSFKEIASMPLPGRNPTDVVIGDFDQDGNPDLLVGDDDGTLTLLRGDGTGKMAPAGTVAHVSSVVSIAVGDFNHDGVLDVAISDWRASSVEVLLGAGKGSLRSVGSFPLRMPGKTPHITVADFNGDGIPDLAVVYDDDDGDTYDVMLGNGSGAFTFAPSLSLARDPNSHCVT